MLYTLFSPSEGKHHGGTGPALNELLFGKEERREILEAYDNIVNSGDIEAVKSLFGYKKESDCEPYIGKLFETPTMPAFERYDGVAYDYLDTSSLNDDAMSYLGTHTVIFSNLYGPIMGGDLIADYKVKQGNDIGGIAPDVYYKKAFSDNLDALLEGHDVLDLRAGYYDKFYKPSQPFTTLKFIKGGKVVSHWAKAYRGTVLRQLALNSVDS
ncbi:MAG: peroxide stress protein YaaA, partial [Sulfurimonadaceae bacterium]|nr:peroxide stress protein YaaA [Sulfurimonadaceae bacterium]